MKKYIGFTILAALLIGVITPAWSLGPAVRMYGTSSATKPLSDFQLQNVGNGDVYYVHDTDGDDARNGKAPRTCLATEDEAIDRCTANQGDTVYLLPGHEVTDGFDADVAGITIIGMGEGADMPEITYDAVDDTITIGAASVTVRGLRLIAGISDVVAAFTVEAAGDDFLLEGCEFPEPGTATFEFLDVIDLAALATGFKCIGNTYVGAATSLTNHFIEAGNGVNADMVITDNVIYGEFAVAAIWSNKVDTNALIARNTITNLTSGEHAIEFTTTASGEIVGNTLYGDTEANILDSGSMFTSGNDISVAIDLDGIPLWVIDNGLNHFFAIDGTEAYAEQAATDSILAKIMCSGAAATLNTYNNTTDSLQAIAASVTAGGGAATALAAVELDHIAGTDTTVAADADLTLYVADGTILSHIMDANAAVVDYDASTDSLQAISDALAVVDANVDEMEAGEFKGTWITTSAVTSSSIVSNVQTGVIATVSGGGAFLTEVFVCTDGTGLAGPTNIELSTDCVIGAYNDEDEPIGVEVIGSFGANLNVATADWTTNVLPIYLQTGDQVFIHGDAGVGTGPGIAYVVLKWNADHGAIITPNDLP